MNTLNKEVSLESLYRFLQLMDSEYIPPLSEKIELRSFAEKLIRYANLFCEFDKEGEIKGLVAVYAIDFERQYAYIPIVGISPSHRGEGIATRLVGRAIELVKGYNGRIKVMGLYSNNPIAIQLYHKYGFKNLQEENGRVYMELIL